MFLILEIILFGGCQNIALRGQRFTDHMYNNNY